MQASLSLCVSVAIAIETKRVMIAVHMSCMNASISGADVCQFYAHVLLLLDLDVTDGAVSLSMHLHCVSVDEWARPQIRAGLGKEVAKHRVLVWQSVLTAMKEIHLDWQPRIVALAVPSYSSIASISGGSTW